MDNEWEKEKEQILNSLLGSGQDLLELPSQNEVNFVSRETVKPLHYGHRWDLSFCFHFKGVVKLEVHVVCVGFCDYFRKQENVCI